MVCTNLELDRVNKQKQIEAKEHEHRQRELAIQELEQKAKSDQATFVHSGGKL
jgi:hypothetical protein